jgi:hypothetical protein
MAARWASDHLQAIEESDPVPPIELNDRAADAWSPLFAIAEVAGREWLRRAQAAAVELSGAVEAETTGEMLLSDIRDAFQARNADRLKSKDLVEYLVGLEDRQWREIGRGGKPLSQTGLASRLKLFNAKPKQMRFEDSGNKKGYERRDFDDAFGRYLPSPSPSPPNQVETSKQMRQSAAFEQNQLETRDDGVSGEKSGNRSNSAGCFDVSVRNRTWGSEEGDGVDAGIDSDISPAPPPHSAGKERTRL